MHLLYEHTAVDNHHQHCEGYGLACLSPYQRHQAGTSYITVYLAQCYLLDRGI
jgi:hypothetical protein